MQEASRSRADRTLAWVLLGLALLVTTLVRVRLLAYPLERDEGEFAYAGQLILQGIPPYTLAYNMKLPGTYLTYAGIMALFGQSDVGVHLGLVLVCAATIVAVFFFARDLFGPRAAGCAALSYALLSLSPSVNGLSAHATQFMALPIVLGTWALWKALESGRSRHFLASGLLYGATFVLKQQGVFFALFGGLTALAWSVTRKPFRWPRAVASVGLMAAGVILPYAATCLWLWRAGVFDRFWFWTVSYARQYEGLVTLSLIPGFFWRGVVGALGPNWPLWAAALAGAWALGGPRAPRRLALFVFAFLGFSFLSVCAGFYFRAHYFVTMLPAVALLSGSALSRMLARAPSPAAPQKKPVRPPSPSRDRSRARPRAAGPHPPAAGTRLLRGIAAAGAIAILLLPVWWQRGAYLLWSPAQLSRATYGLAPFVESPEIARYIRTHTKPGDRLAVIGSEPQLYFYSGRRSATGYIYTYALMEAHPYALHMQEEMIREIERARPEMIVFVTVPDSWDRRAESRGRIFEWANAYLQAHYRRVGLVDILSKDRTDYHWDGDLNRIAPQSQYSLWILRRVST